MICLPLSNFSRGKAMMTVISSLTDASSVQFSCSVVSDSAIPWTADANPSPNRHLEH